MLRIKFRIIAQKRMSYPGLDGIIFLYSINSIVGLLHHGRFMISRCPYREKEHRSCIHPLVHSRQQFEYLNFPWQATSWHILIQMFHSTLERVYSFLVPAHSIEDYLHLLNYAELFWNTITWVAYVECTATYHLWIGKKHTYFTICLVRQNMLSLLYNTNLS